AIIVFATPINKIYSRYKSESLVAAGILILSASMILLPFAPSSGFVFLVIVTYGFGFGVIFPSMNTTIAEHSELHERGQATGLSYSYVSLGSVAGSVLAGYFATVFNLPFLGIGLLTLVMLVILMFIRYRLEISRQ